MNPLRRLHDAGQSIWLDFIRRELLTSGTLKRYIGELSVTGLTSNPSIFKHAITETSDYDEVLIHHAGSNLDPEALFFLLALEDIRGAAECFRPIYERTRGGDGFVSLEVSPALADDTGGTVAAAKDLHARAGQPNVLIKIPGTRAGLPAIEETIAAGIPVNVTLLFDTRQCLAAAEAYTRGVERRLAAGLDAKVPSVASLFISRWDVATETKLPAALAGHLGVAVGQEAHSAYCGFMASERWTALSARGATPQRLLFASTGTKNPRLPDTFYVSALAAAGTVNTIPEKTLLAFADHGEVGALLGTRADGAEEVLRQVTQAGIDRAALAQELQDAGRDAFVRDFDALLECVKNKVAKLRGRP